MVRQLQEAGIVRTASVASALRAVPREAFLPDVDLRDVYEDGAVIVKWSPAGIATSSVSQPSIVAAMLEHLSIRGGNRVLEVGTGMGYNSALLSLLVGEEGRVVTVELDADLAGSARTRLNRCGVRRVEVVCADGRHGYSPGSPFERIIVTAGARQVEPAWQEQLAAGGILVVPVVDGSGMGSIVVGERHGDVIRQRRMERCGFLPIRG